MVEETKVVEAEDVVEEPEVEEAPEVWVEAETVVPAHEAGWRTADEVNADHVNEHNTLPAND